MNVARKKTHSLSMNFLYSPQTTMKKERCINKQCPSKTFSELLSVMGRAICATRLIFFSPLLTFQCDQDDKRDDLLHVSEQTIRF